MSPLRCDGNDLKQISRVLNVGGEPPVLARPGDRAHERVVDRIDMTVAEVTRPDSPMALDALGVRVRRLGCAGGSDVCHPDLVIGGTRRHASCRGVLMP